MDEISPTSSAGPSSPVAKDPERLQPEQTLDGSTTPSGPFVPVKDAPPFAKPQDSAGFKTNSTAKLGRRPNELEGNVDQGSSGLATPTKLLRKYGQGSPQVSDELSRHQNTTSGRNITVSSPTEAQRPQSPQKSAAAKESASRRGTGEGSLLCSPLPSPFRRDRTIPKSRLVEGVSIFEGLIKPASSPENLGSGQSSTNKEPTPNMFLTGNSILDGNRKKPSFRLPEKLRLFSRRNKSKNTFQEIGAEEASSNYHTKRLEKRPEGELEPENYQGRSHDSRRTNKDGILERISSSLRHTSASLQNHTRGARSSITNNASDEDHTPDSSRGSRSTEHTRDATRRQQTQNQAAESLRKRLKAELRPDMSADGLHQIPMTQHHEDPQTGGLTRHGKQHQVKSAEKMPTLGIQRVSTKWNNENPFQTSGNGTTKVKTLELTGHRDPHGSEEGGSNSPYGSIDFSQVAFASVPGSRTVYPNSGSRRRASRSSASTEAADAGGAVLSRKEETGGSSGDDDAQPAVVMANAECELEHPRPSRSSERDIIKVLCEGEGEGSEGQDHRRKSEISRESSLSYRTAPTGT